MSRLRRILHAAAFFGVVVSYAAGVRANGWDWDEVLMIAMGFAGIAYIIVDQIRSSKLDRYSDDFDARLARIELVWTYAAEEAELRLLADKVERFATPPDLTQLVDRVSTNEENVLELAERVATLEARADHKPWTLTRRKDGKFASVTAEEGETPK